MDTVSLMDVGIYTVQDLAALREQRDDLTVQLIDGEIVMTPSPGWNHQVVQTQLLLVLGAALPPHLRLIAPPLDLRLDDRTVIQPDGMVLDRDLRFDHEVTQSPRLVVEILSPSSRLTDLVRKPKVLARFGVEHYWVIDPEHPAIRVFRLTGGAYVSDEIVEGEERFETTEPFPVGFRPVDLTR